MHNQSKACPGVSWGSNAIRVSQRYYQQLSMAVNVVHDMNPLQLVQEGWLSSSGSLIAKDPDTVEVSFDKFWVDFGSTKLRPTLGEGAKSVFATLQPMSFPSPFQVAHVVSQASICNPESDRIRLECVGSC